MKTSNPLLRRKTTPNKPMFYMPTSKDVVSGLNVNTVISGTRYRTNPDSGLIESVAPNIPAVEDNGLRMCPAFTQYFLNNQTPVTQSITLPAGSYCLWIEGTGSASYNGNTATAGNPIVFTLASGFTGDCVISGTVTKCMLNGGFFMAPFTPTSGTPVAVVAETATATTGMSFDLDNALLTNTKNALRGPNGQGHLEVDATFGGDSSWLPTSFVSNNPIFSVNNSTFLGALRVKKDTTTTTIRIDDNTNTGVFVSSSITSGNIYKIILDWGYLSGVLKMRLKVDGVASSVVNFSGSFGSQDLRFGYGSLVNSWIKNLKFLPRPLW